LGVGRSTYGYSGWRTYAKYTEGRVENTHGLEATEEGRSARRIRIDYFLCFVVYGTGEDRKHPLPQWDF